MESSLSPNAIENMHKKVVVSDPLLQVLRAGASETPASESTSLRFLLSDGVHTLAATLSPDYHRPVFKADQNPLIRLSNYDVREVPRSGIVLIVCFEFEVVAPLYHVIGHPVKIVQSRFTPPGRVQGGTSLGRPASAEVGEGAGSRNGVGKVSRVEVEVPRCSIGALTPTVQTWEITARVTSKSDVHHYSNSRGAGKLFRVKLLDESGEICATVFNDDVDKLNPILEEGRVYRISNARVKKAKKEHTKLLHEYEITFHQKTKVEPAKDDQAPEITFTFVDLAHLKTLEKDSTCDVLGVVQDHGQLSQITAKATQEQFKLRELTIVDRSSLSCQVTLWEKDAETWQESGPTVVALRSVTVKDYGGRSLSVGRSATVVVDPEIREALALRTW